MEPRREPLWKVRVGSHMEHLRALKTEEAPQVVKSDVANEGHDACEDQA